LVAAATELNIKVLRARATDRTALNKYAAVAALFLPAHARDSEQDLLARWMDQLHHVTTELGIQRLQDYGVEEKDFATIVANSRGSSMKTNPIALEDDELMTLLQARA
jgi:alcohol dehydrogenase class IV